MKNICILIITLSCFALFSYGHFSLTGNINSNEIAWKQFNRNGTLVYSNSGIYLFAISFLKSLPFSIAFSIVLMIKLKFANTIISSIKSALFLNIFVFITGIICLLISIPLANLYSEFGNIPKNTITNFYPIILSDFIHFFTLTGLVAGIILVSCISHKKLQLIFKF